MSLPEVKGLWCLVGTNPPLWTADAADVIRNRKTGKEYVRGKMTLFTAPNIPEKIEDKPDEWEFIHIINGKPLTEEKVNDYARGIWVNQLFGK